MLKLFFELMIFPFRLTIWFIKAMFWIPLILLGLILDDGPGMW